MLKLLRFILISCGWNITGCWCVITEDFARSPCAAAEHRLLADFYLPFWPTFSTNSLLFNLLWTDIMVRGSIIQKKGKRNVEWEACCYTPQPLPSALGLFNSVKWNCISGEAFVKSLVTSFSPPNFEKKRRKDLPLFVYGLFDIPVCVTMSKGLSTGAAPGLSAS